jgi:hypothetical protein
VAFLALPTAVAVAFLTAPATVVAFLLGAIMGSSAADAVAFLLAGWAAARPVGSSSRTFKREAAEQKGP